MLAGEQLSTCQESDVGRQCAKGDFQGDEAILCFDGGSKFMNLCILKFIELYAEMSQKHIII